MIINYCKDKMSFTFTLSEKSSVLSYDFSPPIYLDEEFDYEIGLTNFDSYNSIPNIDEKNNCFEWHRETKNLIQVPKGSYELEHIATYIEDYLKSIDSEAVIRISTDSVTGKVIIRTNGTISFNVKHSLGSVLGFGKRILSAENTYFSTEPVRIFKVNTILIDCNIALGSFLNGKPVHIIHQFFPTVPFGYKIVETPSNILYFPISTKSINNITIRVLDQDGDIVNFNGEIITIRLHLRKIML